MSGTSRAIQQSIPVFYRSEMTADSRFFAPGTFKPAARVGDWMAHGLPISICSFDPATVDDLCLAHGRQCVEGVLGGRRRNGCGEMEIDVAASLPCTTGAKMDAAEEAVLKGAVACAFVSGSHHAHNDTSSGFCTFNGLVVTARHLQIQGYAHLIGILDLDHRCGDGTDEILQRLALKKIRDVTPDMETRQARDLAALACSFGNHQVLLCQARTDPQINDHLGGWKTTEQLSGRDRIASETARVPGLPVAWNREGGHQHDEWSGIGPVLAIRSVTMPACAAAYSAVGDR